MGGGGEMAMAGLSGVRARRVVEWGQGMEGLLRFGVG